MISHIPILNTTDHFFVMTAFILISLSGQSLAGIIHSRWLMNTGIKLMTVAVFIKGLTVVWGFILVPWAYTSSIKITALFVCAGLLTGTILFYLEEGLIRVCARYHLSKNQKFSAKNSSNFITDAKISSIKLSTKKLKPRGESGLKRSSNNLQRFEEFYQFSLLMLMGSAVFEECIFRGFLLKLSLQCSSSILIVLSLTGITLAFSFSHIHFGLLQLVLKMLFSFIMLCLALFSGSIFISLSAHLLFNVLVWFKSKNTSFVPLTPFSNQMAILG